MQTESAAAILGWVARAKAIRSKGFGDSADDFLAAHRAPEQARRILKSPLGAGSSLDSDLGSTGVSIGSWSDSARTRSAFYRILADGGFTRVPMRTRLGITSAPLQGALVAEGDAIPLSRLTLTNFLLEPIKASALIVVTDTLVRDVSAAGQQLFNRELIGAVSDSVDNLFIDLITSTATTSNPSGGNTAVDAWTDLRTAILAVSAVGNARLYVVCAPDVAARAATLATTDGAQAFVAASPTGGELCNIPMLVSSGVTAGSLYVVNAAAIAADGGPVTVDATSQGDVLMDTAPTMDGTTPTPAQVVSMFQSNSTALKANAWFGAVPLRDNAVAEITSINWGG